MKANGRFISIEAKLIEKALKSHGRQYLAGNLGLPQDIEHVPDKELEIGITSYSEKTSEKPHWHPVQWEYQYVLAGETTYINVITKETYTYRAGDFYAILPEICYAQHSMAGTEILFIKRPAINDKTMCKNCRRKGCPARLEQHG